MRELSSNSAARSASMRAAARALSASPGLGLPIALGLPRRLRVRRRVRRIGHFVVRIILVIIVGEVENSLREGAHVVILVAERGMHHRQRFRTLHVAEDADRLEAYLGIGIANHDAERIGADLFGA